MSNLTTNSSAMPGGIIELLRVEINVLAPSRRPSQTVFLVNGRTFCVPTSVSLMHKFARFRAHVLATHGVLISYCGADWWAEVVAADERGAQ